MQGYWWRDQQLRAWLLERDPVNGEMLYLDGPRDPRTGRDIPIPGADAVALSPRKLHRESQVSPAFVRRAPTNAHRSPQSVSFTEPTHGSSFSGPRYNPWQVEQQFDGLDHSHPTNPVGPMTFAPDMVSNSINASSFHGYHSFWPPLPDTVQQPQLYSRHSSTSSSSSAYLPPDKPGLESFASQRRTLPHRPQHKRVPDSSTTSSARYDMTIPRGPRTESRNAVNGLTDNNAVVNKIVVQNLDARNGIKDLRLCLDRDMHFSPRDFTIKPGKSSKGKLQAFLTFSTTQQAKYTMEKLNGAKIGHNTVKLSLEREDMSASESTASKISSTSSSSVSRGGQTKAVRTGEPIIIDGSVRD